MKKYTPILLLLLLLHTAPNASAQGYITDGDNKGGMTPYATIGANRNEGQTGYQAGLGLKTYGKDNAPLGGQVELAYLNTGINSGGTSSFLNFSFMGAVSTFRRHYNYHVGIGPSIMFNIGGQGDNAALYNFYPRLEAGGGYRKFMLKLGANLSLNNNYTHLYSLTLCYYPYRPRTWNASE